MTGKISRINSAIKKLLLKTQNNIAEGNNRQAVECAFGMLDGIDMVLQKQCNSQQGTLAKRKEVLSMLHYFSHLANEPQLHSLILYHALTSISSGQSYKETITQEMSFLALQMATSKPDMRLLIHHFETYLEENPHYTENKRMAINMLKASKTYLDEKAYNALMWK